MSSREQNEETSLIAFPLRIDELMFCLKTSFHLVSPVAETISLPKSPLRTMGILFLQQMARIY